MPDPMIAITLLLAVLTPFCQSVANNLHTYDGISTAEVLADDVFFEIVEPEELQYTYRLRLAQDFGVPFGKEFKWHSHVLVLAEPATACDVIRNAEDVDGNIVMVERGDCPFIQKALMVESAGAMAVIVTDTNASSDDAEYFVEMVHDQTSADVSIPVGYLLSKNGQMIQNTLRRLGQQFAIINIPMNLTHTPPDQINHPPWVEW